MTINADTFTEPEPAEQVPSAAELQRRLDYQTERADKMATAWRALDDMLKSENGRIERLPNGKVLVTKDGTRAWLGSDPLRAVEYMVLDVSDQVAKKLGQ